MSKEFKSDEDIKKFISEKPLKKILLLSGENSFNKTGAKKIFKEYLKKNEFKIFLKKKKLPEIDELEKIIETVGNFRPDLIIAIGGGCVMDLAKISSVVTNSKNIKEDVINSNFIENKIKVLAIPTTAGSGAEVTSNAVIYLNKIKYSVEGPSVRPDYFFLKPELILSSNFYLDATACFDAISQSVESLFSINSNDESMMFFCKGVIETVKKLGWAPDIIHCNGWFSALVPMYIKKLYNKDPMFSNTKIYYTVFDNPFKGDLNNSLSEKLLFEDLQDKDVEMIGNPTFDNLNKFAISYSDAVVQGSKKLSKNLLNFIKNNNIPVLVKTDDDNFEEQCLSFYDSTKKPKKTKKNKQLVEVV